jgi:hypothetical protein
MNERPQCRFQILSRRYRFPQKSCPFMVTRSLTTSGSLFRSGICASKYSMPCGVVRFGRPDKQFQKRVEKEFRRSIWNAAEGMELERSFPSLPGHVRITIPEIQTIASCKSEFLLLLQSREVR